MKTIEIKKRIVTETFTFSKGDIVYVSENTHYFQVETFDSNNQKLSISYVFGTTACKNGGLEVKPEDLPKARIECAEFIKKHLCN